MTGPASRQDLEIRLDPADFAKLVRDARAFDAQLAKALRKRIRDAAVPAVKDVQHRLRTATSHTNSGLREGLARGTKVSIKTGARTAGVSIVTTGAKLPADKQAMVRAYDKPRFRHPVYGHTDRWVSQRGRPYFGSILDSRKRSMLAAIDTAMHDAADTIRAGEATS